MLNVVLADQAQLLLWGEFKIVELKYYYFCLSARKSVVDVDVSIVGRTSFDIDVRCGIPKVEDVASVPVARVASGMNSKPGEKFGLSMNLMTS